MVFYRTLVFATLIAGICSLEGEAIAGVIYDNLPPASSNGGLDPVADDGPAYNSFSTGSSDLLLTDVKMLLQRSLGTASQFKVSLLSDSSHSPGSLLTTLGTFNDSDLSLTAAIYDISVNSYALAANTRYWIELSSVPNSVSTVEWNYASSAAGTGVSSEYWAYTPSETITVAANSDAPPGPYQMSVTTTTNVPEPGTLYQVLTAVGVSVFAASRRRLVRF